MRCNPSCPDSPNCAENAYLKKQRLCSRRNRAFIRYGSKPLGLSPSSYVL